MQLILPQSELEQAIKNYVNDLMNVKDGTEMTIDLKAGRGIDGFTATVDITKAGSATPVKTVVPTATPLAVAAPVIAAPPLFVPPQASVKAKAEPVSTPVATEPKEENTILDLSAFHAEDAKADDTKSEQPEAATVETEAATATEGTVVPPATPVRRPLFGNLKKPE